MFKQMKPELYDFYLQGNAERSRDRFFCEFYQPFARVARGSTDEEFL